MADNFSYNEGMDIKKMTPYIIGAVITILVLIGGFLWLRNATSGGIGGSAASGVIRDHNARVAGKADDKIKVVYLFDLQCPACRANNENMKTLKGKEDLGYQLIYKNLPLSIHSFAKAAAYSAEAAKEQGKYVEFIDKTFEMQDQLSNDLFETIAKDIGLDVKKFNDDRNSKAIRDRVDADEKDTKDLTLTASEYASGNKISSTPSYIVIKDDKIVTWWGGGVSVEELNNRVNKIK